MKKIIATDKAPAAIGPYSQAVVHNNVIYVSGQIGLDPVTGDFVSNDFSQQAERAFQNIQAIVEAAGSDLSQVLKLNVSVVEMSDFAAFNKVMESFFKKPYPARACVSVRELPKRALVEIEAIVGIVNDG